MEDKKLQNGKGATEGRPKRVVRLLNDLHPQRLGRKDKAENFDRFCRDLEMRDLQEAAR